tara:strand:- start:197 stop:619 length:423 start_codon:yes stop_codon:yes gene_type:complete
MSSTPDGLEVFLDGRYLGSTPLSHKLSKNSTGHALQVVKGSKRYAGKLTAVTGPSWVHIELDGETEKGPLGMARIISEPVGVDVVLKKNKIGKTPLTLLGQKGQSWDVQVGPSGSSKKATVKATKTGEATRMRFSSAGSK